MMLGTVMLAAILGGGIQEKPALESEIAAGTPPTVVATPSAENRSAAAGWHDGRDWMDQHSDCVKLARAPRHDLIFLGDSITQSFGGEGRRTGQPGRDVLRELFPGLRIANMGISGDRTQHLLWRLGNGALDGPAPGAYVIAIGTNNIGHDRPQDIEKGIECIIGLIREKRPGTPILLCPILPRGHLANDPARTAAQLVNEGIQGLAREPDTYWVPCWEPLLDAEGGLHKGCHRSDGIHLTEHGYQLWGRVISDSRSGIPAHSPESGSLE
jgi:lysophospholipase L1-like esterase